MLLFWTKYRLGHPELLLFLLSLQNKSGPKCPKNSIFHIEIRSTLYEGCTHGVTILLMWLDGAKSITTNIDHYIATSIFCNALYSHIHTAWRSDVHTSYIPQCCACYNHLFSTTKNVEGTWILHTFFFIMRNKKNGLNYKSMGCRKHNHWLKITYGRGCMFSLSSRQHRHGGPSVNDVIANVSVRSPWISYFHQLEKNISGSKDPKNISFHFQHKITAQHRCTNTNRFISGFPMDTSVLSIHEAFWDICNFRRYHRPRASKWEPAGRESTTLPCWELALRRILQPY